MSSTVRILLLLDISIITLPRNEVFPALLVPATSIVLLPSTMNEISPAASGSIILLFTNNGSVHGLSLCRLNAYAIPVGFNGSVIAATLALAAGSCSSVSSTGFASSSGLPEIILSFDAQLSPSGTVGMMFVMQSPYIACTMNMGILPIGELTTMSCIFSSCRSTSMSPNPTVYRTSISASSSLSFCLSLIPLFTLSSSSRSFPTEVNTALILCGSVNSSLVGLCSDSMFLAASSSSYLSSVSLNSGGIMWYVYCMLSGCSNIVTSVFPTM